MRRRSGNEGGNQGVGLGLGLGLRVRVRVMLLLGADVSEVRD